MDLSPVIIAFVVLIISAALVSLVVPVKLAAKAMGAKRTSLGYCFLALVAASFMHCLGLTVPVVGSIAAFFLGALAFALVLQSTYLQGIGISILHVVFGVLLLTLLALAGISVLSVLGAGSEIAPYIYSLF